MALTLVLGQHGESLQVPLTSRRARDRERDDRWAAQQPPPRRWRRGAADAGPMGGGRPPDLGEVVRPVAPFRSERGAVDLRGRGVMARPQRRGGVVGTPDRPHGRIGEVGAEQHQRVDDREPGVGEAFRGRGEQRTRADRPDAVAPGERVDPSGELVWIRHDALIGEGEMDHAGVEGRRPDADAPAEPPVGETSDLHIRRRYRAAAVDRSLRPPAGPRLRPAHVGWMACRCSSSPTRPTSSTSQVRAIPAAVPAPGGGCRRQGR